MVGGGVLHPRILAARNLKILKLGGKVSIGSNKLGAVQIGFGHVGIVDNQHCRALWENNGNIVFSGTAHMGPGTRIVNTGELRIGSHFCINAATEIICYKKISFGSEVLISWDCLIMDTDFHRVITLKDGRHVNEDEAIAVGNHVWIGCRSTILKGSLIPSDSVVAAGSIIYKKYSAENAIYSSNGKIKDSITWKR